MKKLLVIAFIVILVFTLVACGGGDVSINVNVENPNELHNTKFGISSMMEIGDGLWYDSTTRIVYWWNGASKYADYTTAPAPYYAPNGFPYRYNTETNTFEQISNVVG